MALNRCRGRGPRPERKRRYVRSPHLSSLPGEHSASRETPALLRSCCLSPPEKERIAYVSRKPRFERCAVTLRLQKRGNQWWQNRRTLPEPRNVPSRVS